MEKFILSDALSFVNVVQDGSIAGAAKKLGVSPSNLSKRLTRLEKQLDVQLLTRTTRRLVLTEVGQQFYERCTRIQSEIQEAEEVILQTHQKAQGTLRVNAPTSFGQAYLISAIHAFLQRYPDIQVELILGSQFADFMEHRLDLAIHLNELPNKSLFRTRRITYRSTGVYASPSYLKHHGIPETPADLTIHNCLTYQPKAINMANSSLKHDWLFYYKKNELKVSVSGNFKVNTSQALVSAALSGLGIVRLSSFMVTEEVKTGRLISLLKNYCPHHINVLAAYPNQRFLPSKVRVFIDFLVEHFKSNE